jgi:hypothetical protein
MDKPGRRPFRIIVKQPFYRYYLHPPRLVLFILLLLVLLLLRPSHYFANSMQRVSRSTVTRIWPG